MQVVSGAFGRERMHFEAPAAKRLEKEMEAFLKWFNGTDQTDPVLRAGLAHLWFVTIHPFDDGNGRIARKIRRCVTSSNSSITVFSSKTLPVAEAPVIPWRRPAKPEPLAGLHYEKSFVSIVPAPPVSSPAPPGRIKEGLKGLNRLNV